MYSRLFVRITRQFFAMARNHYLVGTLCVLIQNPNPNSSRNEDLLKFKIIYIIAYIQLYI